MREEDGVVTKFDIPGATSTTPDSINFAGEITGTYLVGTTSSVPGTPSGFVRDANGKITLFASTYNDNGLTRSFRANPVQINVAGEVVGNLSYPLAAPGAFVRSRTGVVQVFSLSEGASYPTVATGLNASGAVVGYSSSASILQAQGFFWSGQPPLPSLAPGEANFTGIDASGSFGTFPTAINAEGAVVGCYSINANPDDPFAPALTYYDFLYEPDGTITTLSVPGTVPSCLISVDNEEFGIFTVGPRTISINREGTIVGSYTNAANVPVGFLQKKDGRFTTFAPPNATMTMPSAINNRDVVIGYFAHGTEIKGFLRLPEGWGK